MIYAIAVFAPLVGALISGLLGKAIGDRAAMGASILGMLIAAVCGPYAFFQLGEWRARHASISAPGSKPANSTSTGLCATIRWRRRWSPWCRSYRC